MKKTVIWVLLISMLAIGLSGCGVIGEKSSSMSMIYGATAVISLLLLIVYCFCIRKKETWMLLLFSSILVVNIGYYTLGISRTLEEALLANRIAYLGSVFLPMAMLMILLKTAQIRYPKWLAGILLGLGIAVFFVAASPGYLDIYYKEVTAVMVNGVAVLQKVYGPWHVLYLFYLLGYFAVTIAVVVYAAVKKKTAAVSHTVILAIAVSVNIGVWLMEQLVRIDFEVLSISYIISELFLLGLSFILQEEEQISAVHEGLAPVQENLIVEEQPPVPENGTLLAEYDQYLQGLALLTKTERAVYDRYVEGKTTKEIMADLQIKENTLKFHNKNLYGKLGVSSRKQLVEIYHRINP